MHLKTSILSFKVTPPFEAELRGAAAGKMLSVSEYIREAVETRLREDIKADIVTTAYRGFCYARELGFDVEDPHVMAYLEKVGLQVLAGLAENTNIPDDRAKELIETGLAEFEKTAS